MNSMKLNRRTFMAKSHKNSLINREGVYHYICDLPDLFNEGVTLQVSEIGNGNMNYVFRIKDQNSRKSVILKYAGEHIRISEEITVSTDRIKIEAQTILYQEKHVSGYVPHIYQYDDVRKCILMEDYSSYSILRDTLLHYERVKGFSEDIVTYLVKSTLPTTDFALNHSAKEEMIKRFSNPHLCEITETFVFTEPFNPVSQLNDIYGPNQEYIKYEIFMDENLQQHIAELKHSFRNNKQALLHGDLHTGSIFVNNSSVIVFDFEFAFYGPIGFDLGNLIANLIFAWLHGEASDEEHWDFLQWLEETVVQTIDQFVMKFKLEFNQIDKEMTSKSKDLLEDYLEGIIRDTASYAGVELIRRIVGMAHVTDITSISSKLKRSRAERIAINIAKYYILRNENLKKGADFVKVVKEIVAKYR